MKHIEYEIQKQVCKYLELQYPRILFASDTIGNVKLTAIQGARNKAIQKTDFRTPDLLIFHPKNGYSGLLIELKKESPFYKGQYCGLKKDARIEAQSRDLTRLNLDGYFACFAWSFDMAKVVIDYYMTNINSAISSLYPLPQIEPHTEYFYEFFDR